MLGIREGATENAAAAQDLLEHLVAQGVDPQRQRLFVIDGSKALRSAINAVFGEHTPVQRCRNHKLRNVLERLPKDQQNQVRSLLKAAWKMNHQQGMTKFRKLAEWLDREHPDAAATRRVCRWRDKSMSAIEQNPLRCNHLRGGRSPCNVIRNLWKSKPRSRQIFESLC